MFKHALFGAVALTAGALSAQSEPFTFVALGDAPYGKPEEVFAPFETLIATVNARKPAFTIHVGDTKSGSTPCDDAMLDAQLGFLNSFAPAAVYTPGDNEWTDCHRPKAGGFDPLERLDYIRRTYFTDPSTSFGTDPIALESQAVVMADRFAAYVENTRFAHEGVHFIQAHVVGSNNNLEARDQKAAMEFFARDAANVAWLSDSFDQAIAADAAAVVLSIHADMFEFDFGPAWAPEGFLRHSGFINFAGVLTEKAAAFDKPVLLIFGDSHKFRVFRPFPKAAPKMTALEVFGSADMHAVEVTVTVTPDDPAVFGMTPILNPALDGQG